MSSFSNSMTKHLHGFLAITSPKFKEMVSKLACTVAFRTSSTNLWNTFADEEIFLLEYDQSLDQESV
ncbi:hypothetical protein RJ640_028602 [Escallonia rubra]|uniref:Uncharacterized protein n=1 Tax=Escallonia rubra TaxID=112253 RepID=A0AA88RES7_9ASTE|nr:hypothetical protein RJ640_028602 [Escallonia rubra]